MSFDTGALYDVRETLATIIEDGDLGCTVFSSWGPAPVGPTVVLDGGGWQRETAQGMYYTIRVNVTYGDQSGEAIPKIEELARQVWDVMYAAGWPVDTVPPPGVLKFGDREYLAVQMSITRQLTPEG